MWISYAPFDIEAEDLDAIVVLSFYGLFPSVELLALVDVFTAGIASPINCGQYDSR